MRAEDIVALLKTQPFAPFRVHLTDGRMYDVAHPELIRVSRTYLEIGIPSRHEGIMDRFELCALLHIVRIDFLERESTQPNS